MEDPYRGDFPSQPYYSSSSVYSYSPTSTSDCPEHGRSHKKITVILTVSVLLATIGVISIAGVAAYLGFISKQDYHNDSSAGAEESLSYLQSNSTSPSGSKKYIDKSSLIIGSKAVRNHAEESSSEELEGSHSSSSDLIKNDRDRRFRNDPFNRGRGKNVRVTSTMTSPVRPVSRAEKEHLGEAYPEISSHRSLPVTPSAAPKPSYPPHYHHPHYYNPINMISPSSNPSSLDSEEPVLVFTEKSTGSNNNDEATKTRRPHQRNKPNVHFGIADSVPVLAEEKTTPLPSQSDELEIEMSSSSDAFSKRMGAVSDDIKVPENKEVDIGESTIPSGKSEKSIITATPPMMYPTIKPPRFNSNKQNPTRKAEQEASLKRFGSSDEPYIYKHPAHQFKPSRPAGGAAKEPPSPAPSYNGNNMKTTLDRITLGSLDAEPWVPVVRTPDLEKRARIDIDEFSQKPAPTKLAAPSDDFEFSERMDTFSDEKFIEKTAPSKIADLKSSKKNDESKMSLEIEYGREPVFKSETDSEIVAPRPEGGFKPLNIPTYTVIIPHIPNPTTEYKYSEAVAQDNLSQNASNETNNYSSDATAESSDVTISSSTTPISLNFSQTLVNRSQDTQGNSKLTDSSKIREKAPASSTENGKLDGILLADHNTKVDNMDNDNLENVEYETLSHDDSEYIMIGDSDTKIYKLDPNAVDMVPDTLGSAKHPLAEKIWNTKSFVDSTKPKAENRDNKDSPDEALKSTTDLIISTLSSLNLIKVPPPTSAYGDEENRTNEKPLSDEAMIELPMEKRNASILVTLNGTENGTDPLFPPVRSYVGVNQPLRPKPDTRYASSYDDIESENWVIGEGKEEEGSALPALPKDLTTTSSLQKVLSMMMTFEKEGDEGGRKLSKDSDTVNITTQSINLIVADHNNRKRLIKSAPLLLSTKIQKREEKSFKKNSQSETSTVSSPPRVSEVEEESRDFNHEDRMVRFPVISRPSNFRYNSNSPVYKFKLKKGQAVEDLLKEIFHNYTKIEGYPLIKQKEEELITSNQSYHNISPDPIPLKISRPFVPNIHDEVIIKGSNARNHTTSTERSEFIQTSTSIIISDSIDGNGCHLNNSFRCASTGNCISAFGRCNGLRDCDDNSDEKNCLCVDLLKAQMQHRKICDGVPDCEDFSDEYSCEWCSPGQYICAGSRACIPRKKICDGKRDCPSGDDESDCVRIGDPVEFNRAMLSAVSYKKSGYLVVRKNGVWGKLCVETFRDVVAHWEVKDLAKAVCKALTFKDFETVEKIQDLGSKNRKKLRAVFYELYQQESKTNDSKSQNGLGFRKTRCDTGSVIRVTCQELQCGIAPRAFTQAARIVGGANALPGGWPWQAALYKDGEYQCGATLISSRWLLSAGHCFYGAQDDYWVARLGTLRRGATVLSPYEQLIRISHIFLHPEYKNVGFVNDVSLLRLEREVDFTDFVRPACLPGPNSMIRDGRMCTVVGWGQLFEAGRVFPDTLQEVQLPLISTAECRKRTVFLPLYKLTEEMFCAGFDRGGRDACLGDSGGPLMCNEADGKWSLYGVTSNGYGCARANRPGVYTKVASYLDWITDKMKLDDRFLVNRYKHHPCPGHRCLLGECLQKRHICNGLRDCVLDGSDEKNCTWS